jgi:hypothetical protein
MSFNNDFKDGLVVVFNGEVVRSLVGVAAIVVLVVVIFYNIIF